MITTIVVGCNPDSGLRKRTLEKIAELKNGSSDILVQPHSATLAEASTDANVIANFLRIHLMGDLSEYGSIDLERFSNLKTIILYDTYQTDEFLAGMPPEIESLTLEQTDVTAIGLQKLSKYNSLADLYISAWGDRFTPDAINKLSELRSLKMVTLDLGPSAIDVSALQVALPECKINLTIDE